MEASGKTEGRITRTISVEHDPEVAKLLFKAPPVFKGETFRAVKVIEMLMFVLPDAGPRYYVQVHGPEGMMMASSGQRMMKTNRSIQFGEDVHNDYLFDEIPPAIAAHLLYPEGLLALLKMDREEARAVGRIKPNDPRVRIRAINQRLGRKPLVNDDPPSPEVPA